MKQVVESNPIRRRRASARHARVVALALLVAGTVACSSEVQSVGPSTNGTKAPRAGGRLVVAVPMQEPEQLLRLVLEPLTAFASDGSVVPYLAESVVPNSTYDRWTVRVRPGIKFHNGELLDANAVKANLDAYSVMPIYATDPLSPIVNTKVLDDRTLEVELSEPWVTFPAHLTAEQSDGTGLIAAPATLAAMGPLFLAKPTADGIYGTGPFILQPPGDKADRWVGQRNVDYWQKGLPYLDSVEIRPVPNNDSRLGGLDSGDFEVAITSRPSVGAGSRTVVTPAVEHQVLAVALNMTKAPFNDPRVRAAVGAATDVEALAKLAGVDPKQIATGPFGPASRWNDPAAPRVAHDPERARTLVAEYEQANGPVRIRLSAADLETDALAIQQELARQWTGVGLEVELAVVDPFLQTATLLVLGDFEAVVGLQFGMPEPDMDYFWWHSSALKAEGKGASYNYVGLDDPALDEALDKARGSSDDAVRRAAFTTVQQRLADAQAYVWLWSSPWSVAVSHRVQGLDGATLPDGGKRMPMIGPRLNFEGVWLEE